MGGMLALKPYSFCSSLTSSSSSFMSKSLTHIRQLQQLPCFSSYYITPTFDLLNPQCQSNFPAYLASGSSHPTNDHSLFSTIFALDDLKGLPMNHATDKDPCLSSKFPAFFPAYQRVVARTDGRIRCESSCGAEQALGSCSLGTLPFGSYVITPFQYSEKHKHFDHLRFYRLRRHSQHAGRCAESQLASYCSSSLSTSSSRLNSGAYPPRAANFQSKFGSSKRRSYAPRTYKPPEGAAQEVPFEYQYSYSEVPKVAPTGFREPPFSPFGPSTLPKPWTGRSPLQKSKKKGKEIDSFNPPPPGKKGVKPVEAPGPFPKGQAPIYARTREEILGEPLTKAEVNELVEICNRDKRQINLGRDGLTHNMLEVIHLHWKRRRVVRIRCKGVPTIDMDNVCFHLEDKTGGKIIHRVGGTVHLFRGRNYNTKFRPKVPLMLWKPAAPIYPRLIKRIPEGLTQEEAEQMRKRGRKVKPLCKLARNGVYLNLVKDVKEAFEVDELVRIDCKGMNPSDYKKIGAKLRDMVPCVLISFEREQILMWRGRDWKPVCPVNPDASAEVLPASTLKLPVTRMSIGQQRPKDLGSAMSEFDLAAENDVDSVHADTSEGASEIDKLWQEALDDGAASLLDGNAHPVNASKDAETLLVAGQDLPSISTSQIASGSANKKATGYANDSASSSPDVLPVEELAKLLAS